MTPAIAAPRKAQPAGGVVPRPRGRVAPVSRPIRVVVTIQYAVARRTLPAAASLRRWAKAAARRDAQVTIRIVGNREARTLNALYRGHEHATNVLTFVYEDGDALTGDIVLCAPVLRREALAMDRPVAHHCAHLIVHGMLHLQGDDHDTSRTARTMEARERAILDGFGVPDPYVIPADPAPMRRVPR